jgi:hypothetical protein
VCGAQQAAAGRSPPRAARKTLTPAPRPRPQADLFAEKTTYRDNLIEQQIIRFVCRQTQAILQGGPPLQRGLAPPIPTPRAPIGPSIICRPPPAGTAAPVRGTYEDFVALGKVIVRRFSSEEQRVLGQMVLLSLVPSWIVLFFRWAACRAAPAPAPAPRAAQQPRAARCRAACCSPGFRPRPSPPPAGTSSAPASSQRS